MEILSFEKLASTQKYLIEKIKYKDIFLPVAVICEEQTDGIGSRDNEWIGDKGNFFSSIAIPLYSLPDDLPLSSASIYFAFIMKKFLLKLNSKVWLKWPNDIYIQNNKIGGVITKKIDNVLVCGIGINLKKSQNAYSALESNISSKNLLEQYLLEVEKFPKWKQIFSEFEVEFELSKSFYVHIKNEKKSLKEAILLKDGSLIIDERKVFSLR